VEKQTNPVKKEFNLVELAFFHGIRFRFKAFRFCFKAFSFGFHGTKLPCILNRLFFNSLTETMQECMQKIFYFFIGNDTDVGTERA
jgi:hypothetical protein